MIQALVELLGVLLALAVPAPPSAAMLRGDPRDSSMPRGDARRGSMVRGDPRDSSMFRGGPRHEGVYSADAGPALSALRWKFDAHGPVRGSPVVLRGAGAVLFGSGDGNLYCLDAATGRERWRAALSGAVVSTPAVFGDLVVATARERTVAALDLATGRPRWRFEAGKDLPFDWEWDYWLSSPTILGGENRVYVGSGDGKQIGRAHV